MTTFGLTASRALKRLRRRLRPARNGDRENGHRNCPEEFFLDGLPLDEVSARRLLSRYGPEGLSAIAAMSRGDREPVPGQCVLWGELRWAARSEDVYHLDDLLLRRVRIGLTSPHGGLVWFDRIRETVQAELGWDNTRWQREVAAYRGIWSSSHRMP
jgi:glycerol-3-phosphate dehydrogenase